MLYIRFRMAKTKNCQSESLMTGTLAIPEDENAKGTQGGTKGLHNSAQLGLTGA
jgi:hypothetical protein